MSDVVKVSSNPLARYLGRCHPTVLTAYGAAAAFTAYFCMYGLRKPFAAAEFEGLSFWGSATPLKSALVQSQLIGYALSKLIGIKFCSEVSRSRRGWALVGLILTAQVSLLLFAVIPKDYKVVAMFLNGIPLGMVWGMVVSYLEGRRVSEALLAGLSCSFIIASGYTKDVGRGILSSGVSDFWMPCLTGLVFLAPFLLAVFLLEQLPDPDPRDVLERTRREPMGAAKRWAFMWTFLPGMAMLIFAYFFMTGYRDYRDNFGVEIFSQLGYREQPLIFTRSETSVAFGVLLALSVLVFIRNNRWGLLGAFVIMAIGTVLLGVATLLLDRGQISGLTYMILTGLGIYLAYVPFGSVLFDRMIASTRVAGTAVFAIYVADFIGYLGPITILNLKDYMLGDMNELVFFRQFSYVMSIGGTILLLASCCYFIYGHEHHETPDELEN